MCSDKVVYSGRLMSLEIRLAIIAEAMSDNTMGRPSSISITIMNDVNGACVTAAKKPAIPIATSAGVTSCWSAPNVSWPMSWPMPAPMDNDGAKIPPGTPHHVVTQVATSFNKKYRLATSASPLSMWRTSSPPAPKVAPPVTKPMMAITRPPPAAKRTG